MPHPKPRKIHTTGSLAANKQRVQLEPHACHASAIAEQLNQRLRPWPRLPRSQPMPSHLQTPMHSRRNGRTLCSLAWISKASTYTGFAGHGLAKTPDFDRTANHGVVFEYAYCGSLACAPSRIFVMTGRFPHQTDSRPSRSTLSQSSVPIPRHLGASGCSCVQAQPHTLAAASDGEADLWLRKRGCAGLPPREVDESVTHEKTSKACST